MARRAARETARPPEPPIAPMIDCVFQLLIFLVVVTDLSQKTQEAVELPMADQAEKEEQADPEEVVINIFSEEEAKKRGGGGDPMHYSVQGQLKDREEIKRMFENLKALRGTEVPGGITVRYTLYIRGDQMAHWLYVQEIMMIAVRFGGIYKLAVAGRMGNPQDQPDGGTP